MSKTLARMVALLLALTLVASACGGDDDEGGGTTSAPSADIDYDAIGLWDDGPCDTAKPKLVIGLMTVFESPGLSLEDQATALEVAAEAFNKRGGANGGCIEVHTCDDRNQIDQAVACVREINRAGVVATVNDQGTAGQADVSAAMADAGIPRVASNVTQDDWADPNAYPLDASGTGVVFMMPKGLLEADVTKIGLIRVPFPEAAALVGLLEDTYKDEGATFPYDAPVPTGTTDYNQFILGAQNAGAEGVTLAVGEQDAIQVVRAGQQLNTELLIGSSLGSFSHNSVTELSDFSDQMVFVWSFPPATADLPVYEALRDDLASTGEDALQPENLKASPMRSWIGLYALLKMIRDAELTTFTRESVKSTIEAARDVPMLDIFGGENWTPTLNHPGIYKRAGTNHWATYKWDPDASAPGGLEGNFVETATLSFDEALCGSIFGAPAAEC
jgi:ABC-type branched-subunit amino acid transport system substrate-binding protein